MKTSFRLSYVVIVLQFAICSCNRHEAERELSHPEERLREAQVSFQMPRRDYSTWTREFGVNEPDLASEEGRKRLHAERCRLSAAGLKFTNALKDLSNVYTNSSETVLYNWLSRVDKILEGFSRESSAAILGLAEKNPVLVKPSLDMFISQEFAIRIVNRYAGVANRLADLTWVKGGEAFAAAEIDNVTFKVLKEIERWCSRKGWDDAQKEAHGWFERNARDRCDSEASHFCRSHFECEHRFSTSFEKLVEKDPRLMKPLSHWYRRHLNCARSILGREPKWAHDSRAVPSCDGGSSVPW